MKIQKWNIAVLFVLSVTMLASCKTNKDKKINEGPIVFSVKTTQVHFDSSVVDNYYVGTAEAMTSVPLSFAVPGTVQQVFVGEGAYVSKGQKLAELNNETFKSTLEMMEAKEKQAADAYERLSKVHANGSLPDIKWVEIETGLSQAKSSVQVARKNVNDCILKAPISGMIGNKSIEPGSNVMPGLSSMTLYKIDNILVKVSIPEGEISKIKKGYKAKIQIPALDNKEFIGSVEETSVAANLITHTYDIKLRINNPGGTIKPGMLCNVFMSNADRSSKIVVPNEAVQSFNQQQFVYVLNNNGNSVRKQLVTTGNYKGNNLIIRTGLQEGERIVVRGQHKLYDNAPVSIDNN